MKKMALILVVVMPHFLYPDIDYQSLKGKVLGDIPVTRVIEDFNLTLVKEETKQILVAPVFSCTRKYYGSSELAIELIFYSSGEVSADSTFQLKTVRVGFVQDIDTWLRISHSRSYEEKKKLISEQEVMLDPFMPSEIFIGMSSEQLLQKMPYPEINNLDKSKSGFIDYFDSPESPTPYKFYFKKDRLVGFDYRLF